MKLVVRSLAGTLLLTLVPGLTQPTAQPDWKKYGFELVMQQESSLSARRRAVSRIVAGYEPALAFLQELNAARRTCTESP